MDQQYNLKVDLDDYSGDREKFFEDYLKSAYKSIVFISFGKVTVTDCKVNQTSGGFHLYYNIISKHKMDRNEQNLLECLLGSDIQKQLYSYAEKDNVLFIGKEIFREDLTEKIRKLLVQINNRDFVQKEYVVDTSKMEMSWSE